jgi:predicted deacetylase
MSNQNLNPKKSKLLVAIDVDDINPTPTYGFYRERDNLKYLFSLQKEFGAKFTLFVVPNWKGNADILQHKDWIQWLVSHPFFEIADHGYIHQCKDPRGQGQEFLGLTANEINERLILAKQTFEECGITVKGMRVPGWTYPQYAIPVFQQHFEWIGEHIIGKNITQLSTGLIKIPYTLSIDNLHSNYYDNGYLILHSHISREEGNQNGWNTELYTQVQQYLQNLQKHANVEYVTFSELVNDYRTKKLSSLANKR